jgi:signal transduction histidine kinase
MSASKILIVDDELSIRIMLTRMIEPLKHEVYCAEDGAMAMDLVRQADIDLVISDLMMPRMTGLDLLAQMRREGFDSAFIVLTGYGDLPQALAAREQYNISNFLVKPIHNMDQFLFDVESALLRRRLERDNRRLLERLQETNAGLEEKVSERTRELEAKNEELRRVSKFRADALKVLGHELRTPLAILSGYHTLAAGGAEADSREHYASMGASIGRLQEIVDKALLLLKADEATEFPLDVQELMPSSLCREVVERIRPFVAERRLEIDPPARCAKPAPCLWDREKMEEVVEELLINAIRASVDGSRIDIGLKNEGDWLELTVTDRGVGVPQGKHEVIFEPFVTLRTAEHHSSGLFEFGAEGVGIGLSTARMWVALHGGTITAEPNVGQPGTTLRVRMPRRPRLPEGGSQARKSDPRRAGGRAAASARQVPA